MINFSFNLSNPFSRRYECKTLVDTLIGEYKNFEIEYQRDNTIIDLWFTWRMRESHAGVMFGIGLLSYNICVTLCDTRHWDYSKNTWEQYDNEIEGC